MGRTTKFRLWQDERMLQNLEAHNYSISNDDYENTIGISRNTIMDDQYGVYTPVIQQLGIDTKAHPDVLIAALITNAINNVDSLSSSGSVICYDGTTFFSETGHPVGLQGQSGVTNVANIDNTGTGNFWILLDCSRPIRPFIFQMRQEYVVTRMNVTTDEEVFMRKTFRYGVDGRVGTGVGFWQMAYASNKDLSNPANYGAARAAMRKFKTDAGLPFGALSSTDGIYLMVGPDLEEAARQLLNSDFMVGYGASSSVSTSNIWKASAQLIVNPFLSI